MEKRCWMVKVVQGGLLEAQNVTNDHINAHVCKNYLD